MKKVVVVTGAAGNLGRAVTKKLVENDYHVTGIVSARAPSEFVNSAGIEMFQADLSDESSIREILQRIFDKYKNIDAAVLTAGGFSMGDIRDTGKMQIDKMFRLNFETAYFTAREVFQKMETQLEGGKIIFIGSKPSLNPGTGHKMVAYTLTKSMLIALSEMINEEGKNKKVYASVVIPDIIDTPENRASMPRANFSDWTSPEFIAEKIQLLISGRGPVPGVLKIMKNEK